MAVLFALSAYSRNITWKDEEAIWTDVVGNGPNVGRAHYNLGMAYNKQGRISEAIEEYKIAIMLKPDDIGVRNNIGVAYAMQGMAEDAIEQFKTILRLKPGFAPARNNLGGVYMSQGRMEEAMEEFKIALRLKPDYNEVLSNLILAEKKLKAGR